MDAILDFLKTTGFALIASDWRVLVMILISCVLMYLAIVKKFEPMLLLPIAFGMLLTNLPGSEMFHEVLFAGGHVHWDLFGGAPITQELIDELMVNSSALAQTLHVGETRRRRNDRFRSAYRKPQELDFGCCCSARNLYDIRRSFTYGLLA